MNNWKHTTLGDISLRKQYGYTESASQDEVGPKFLRITDIQNDFINWDTVPFCPISESDFEKYKLEIGDIVVARTGNSTGATATIKENVTAVFASYLIRFQIDKQKANHNFLDFLLRSKIWYAFVNSVKSGSAQGGANANDFASFPINLPPIPEQKAIANVLTAFDDKIELLQQQNQTLETLAQTIFKEWFGKYQVGDDLPEGWNAGKLGDIAINHSKTFKFNNDKVVFVNTGDVLEGDFLHADEISPIGLPGQAKKVIELYDILYSEIRPKNKRFAFVDFDTSNYVVSTKFMIIRPKTDFSPFILYLILKNQDTINEFNLIAESRSGTFPQITFDSVKEFPVVIPTIEAQRKFEAILKPIMEKQRVNKEQIQTLITTRDVLLPKLMSGEIRVKYK